MESVRGYIYEVFGSFQGEGPLVGERHVFVRFCGCGLDCAYCDTKGSRGKRRTAIFEEGPGIGRYELENPVGVGDVVKAVLAQERVPGFNAGLCITGGEPLEQPEFLKALLAGLGGRLKTVLETNGTLADAFREAGGLIDVVSMDIKLPSVSGMRALWKEHGDFLDACRGRELVVKAVVSPDTPAGEVAEAARLVAEKAPGSMLVIQPATEGNGGMPLFGEKLLDIYREARGAVDRVRVIPQVHKLMGVR